VAGAHGSKVGDVIDVSTILLIGLTSLAAYLVGTRRFGLSRPALGGVVRATLETIGMATVFLVANPGSPPSPSASSARRGPLHLRLHGR
jgi:hypothetical protein